ncbi:pirin family protein [candidate division KSB1 bacterium]|nr:pirin family protein [candidate division KSB1 bacterium]
MPNIRKIKKIIQGRPTMEGAGVHLKRVFGYHHVPEFDPFLLLDDFHGNHPDQYIGGFPWHPHRGIETITYMLAGEVAHSDSMGNKGVIYPGDVQWMTAGSGIIHQEMPKGDESGRMGGFQLWANLPAAHKMTAPRYRDVRSDQIPAVKTADGLVVKIICGEYQGNQGPVRDILIDPLYLDVIVPAGKRFDLSLHPDYTAFAYVFDGDGYFEPERDPYKYEMEPANYFSFKRECRIKPVHLVLFDEGDAVSVNAGEQGVRFLLISGRSLKEPVAWWGPIVMNTQQELRTAMEEYESGTFLKHDR